MLDNAIHSWWRVGRAFPSSPCHRGLPGLPPPSLAHFQNLFTRNLPPFFGQELGSRKGFGGARRWRGLTVGSLGQTCQQLGLQEGGEVGSWSDETIPLPHICGFSSKKLTEYKWIATNSSDRLRHVPNYFSIFFNKSACCLQKKKTLLWLYQKGKLLIDETIIMVSP